MSIQKYLDNFISLSDSELAKFNKKERMAYEDSLKYYRDLHNSLNYAREEGEEKKAIDMAKKSILKGFSLEDIADVTGLSIGEIKEIADSLKN